MAFKPPRIKIILRELHLDIKQKTLL